MHNKKVRGLKRKTRNMIKRICEETENFPTDFCNGYWHLHIPVAQDFIDSNRTPFGIKRLCVETLLVRAQYLIENKPNTLDKYRVVVFLSDQGMFDSQIIIFENDDYFDGFFTRNDKCQRWIPLSKEINFENEWKITIPGEMNTLGFTEEITYEDGEVFNRNIWFIGELEK